MITNRIKFDFETILYGLLFCFPLFSLSVRHWSSVTFSLLTLVGIIYYFSRYKKKPSYLHKYEKLFLWFLIAYVIVFLLSMIFGYPERFSQTRFGNEIRFILVIPLYLMLTKFQYGLRWLVYGATVSIFLSFGFCLHELYVLEKPYFNGEYSKLFTGPVILIYLVLVLSYFIPQLNKKNFGLWALLVILIAMATFSIIASEVRAAYIAYFLLATLFLLLYTSGWKRAVSLLVLFASLTIVSISSQSINSRMTVAFDDLGNYLNMEDHTDPSNPSASTSVGVRLEMWRSSPLFIKDYPLIGVGNGNYQKSVVQYVEQRKIHPATALFDHPHNVFVNATINKGLLGLITTCLVFFFPLFVYLKTYRDSKYSALTGVLYVAVMFIISMNESAPLYKSNFVATFLIFSLVIFQNHIKELNKK